MATDTKDNRNGGSRWPNGAQAAIALTLDNLGEAADLNRKLWPESEPIGKHYTVTKVIPELLQLLKKYNVLVTYFVESWNIGVYGDFILDQIVGNGHELAWHAWQHEAWSKLNEEQEKENFANSFGEQGVAKWVSDGKVAPYRGFRPPGGIIHGDRTMKLARDHGLGYISPAAEKGAVVKIGGDGASMVILPFKWATVDAYFYMETFAGLRKMKGEYPDEPQSPKVLVERAKAEIDKAIEEGEFLSILFHPFLTERPERVKAMEEVLQYLSEKREQGKIWWARMKDIEEWIREHPDSVGTDPEWDTSSWR